MARLVLIDGSAMIYRAYYAIPANFTTAAGLHTNAIYGFATMFKKLLGGRRPELGAVVFDPPGPTFRDELYADYKSSRTAMPTELAEQLTWIDQLVAAQNFPVVRVPGYEADDVIGTLTARAVAAGHEVLIVSGDKDFAQLIGEHVKMLDAMREVTYDAELVRKKWGVPPHQFVDLLALMGDSIDNIPGVPGIGQKGAAQLLEKYGSLDGVLANLEELKGKQKSALAEHRDKAILSKTLASIDCQVPLTLEIEALRLSAADEAALRTLYQALEFHSLLGESVGARASTTETEVVGAASISDLVARLYADGQAVIMPLYDPPSPQRGVLVGLAFAGPVPQYWPVAGPLPPALADALSDPKLPKISHDLKGLANVLANAGVVLGGARGDTMLASFLVEPTKLIPHRLEQLTREYLHRSLPSEKEARGAGQQEKPWSQVSVGQAAGYAGTLVGAVAELWPLLFSKLETEGQTEVYREHELPLAFVLGEMERTGVPVDPEDLGRMGTEFEAKLLTLEAQIHGMAGRTFNIASTKQLADVLFEELKLPVIKKTKTGYSTDSEVLERLAPKHQIAQLILEHRKLAKLISTYTNVLQAAVDPKTHRIHATFQQTTGATGRIISTDPDLQRTPVKTPEGKRIRQAFIAPPTTRLISADWSQIELRILAHVSGDPRLVAAFQEGRDVHRETAARLFGVTPDAVSGDQRRIGKTVNFATIYGQGANALGQILGISKKEAEHYINGYFEAYAGVRTWLDNTILEAEQRGYVTTLLGRRRWIPELSSRNVMDQQAGQRIAANTPIQGSAADLCKRAMLLISRTLPTVAPKTRMLMQIHDELVFEAPEIEVEPAVACVREHMTHAWKLNVPLVVDVGVGATWAEAKE